MISVPLNNICSLFLTSTTKLHVLKHGFQLRAMLGHQVTDVDVMKLELTSGEWTAVLWEMLGADELKHVRQLVVRMHVGQEVKDDGVSPEEVTRRRLRSLRDLHTAGFRMFYSQKLASYPEEVREFPSHRTACYDGGFVNVEFR